MATTLFKSRKWGTSPKIGVTMSYTYKRNGQYMIYDISLSIDPLTSPAYFGYYIKANIKVNGTAQTISSKSVNITVPTKASDIGAATDDHTHTVDSALSSSSTNPVQNKVVNSAITTLTSTVGANTSSISAHSTAISNLQTAVGEIQEITSEEIQNLFK